MSRIKIRKLALTGALASLCLAGCGGGGSTTSVANAVLLSGTVAGGAAVIGTVLITDSKGATKTGTIDATGHYSIDVSTLTGPFVLKASGTVGNASVTYYSAATVADLGGTINITPFTNLIVSNIAGQLLAETYFSDPANIAKIATLVTPTSLAAAETAMQTKLQPVLTAMGLAASVDLLHSAFAADHSGLDAVLDLVKVEVDTATNIATLRNTLYPTVMMGQDDPTLKNDTTSVVNITGITPAAATDLQTVVAKLDALAALFATSLPSVSTLQNAGLFDTSSNFMMGGQTFAQFAAHLSTQQSAIGLKFSNVAIALYPSGLSGTLTAVISSSTPTFSDRIQLKMAKVNGLWLLQGDGMIANVSMTAQAQRDEWTVLLSSSQNSSSGASSLNGIWINIDPSAYNTNNPSKPAVSALVTGPGLGSGVTLVQDPKNTWFDVQGMNYGGNVIPECGSQISGVNGGAPLTTQCVTVAQALDNSAYTVVLKDGSGNSLNGSGYKLTLPKQPYASSTLTATMFPSVTSIAIDGLSMTPSAMLANKSVAVSWNLPTGLLAKNLNIWATTATGASYFNVEKSITPTDTSAVISMGAPMVTTGVATNAGVWLSAADVYGRRLAVSKSVSMQ